MVKRFNAIGSLENRRACVYPLRRIPFDRVAFPESALAGFGRSDILQINNTHVIVTCVAELGHNGLVPAAGEEPSQRVNVTFKPLVETDHDAALRVLEELSVPARCECDSRLPSVGLRSDYLVSQLIKATSVASGP